MKLYDAGMTIAIISLIVLVSFIAGKASIKYLGDENYIEETSEMIIKMETGQDIDLSPNSNENSTKGPPTSPTKSTPITTGRILQSL